MNTNTNTATPTDTTGVTNDPAAKLQADTLEAIDLQIDEVKREAAQNDARRAELNDQLKRLSATRAAQGSATGTGRKQLFKRVAVGTLAVGVSVVAGVMAWRRFGPIRSTGDLLTA